MDVKKIQYWVLFFCGILAAILIADAISNRLIIYTGLTGGAAFLAGFILYAVLFFAILAGFERVSGIRILGFSGRQD